MDRFGKNQGKTSLYSYKVPPPSKNRLLHAALLSLARKKKKYLEDQYFRLELNWRPSAFEADVITTTLRKPYCFKLWYLIVVSAFLTVSCNVKTVRHLAIGSFVSVRMSRSEALGKFEEHERGVRVGRGATLPS